MTPTIPLEDTVVALHQLHPLPSNLVPPSIFDYQHEHIFVLNRILFAQTLAIVPHLSSGGLSRMIYEHFSRWVILEDPSSRFLKLFQAVVVVACGDILRLMALMLGANRLLVMTKDISGLRIMVIGEVFLQLISCSIVL
jgi:hypothetical protein